METWFATKEGKIFVLEYYGKPCVAFERPYQKTVDGYIRIKLPRQSIYSVIHRLVWQYFNGPIPKGLQINHIDGNKLNNKLSNLELISQEQNLHHAMDMGLHNWGRQKIRCIEINIVFNSQTEAAKMLGLHQANIHKVLIGERPHTKGYTFERA